MALQKECTDLQDAYNKAITSKNKAMTLIHVNKLKKMKREKFLNLTLKLLGTVIRGLKANPAFADIPISETDINVHTAWHLISHLNVLKDKKYEDYDKFMLYLSTDHINLCLEIYNSANVNKVNVEQITTNIENGKFKTSTIPAL